MKPIQSVLKEELDNSLRLKKRYEEELRQLPQGALVCKEIKGHKYYYLAKREKGEVKYIYKGKLSKEEVKKYDEAKKIRAKYRKHLSQVKKQIRFLKQSLKSGK